MQKLRRGIDEHLQRIMSSYLQLRSVIIGGDKLRINRKVPQGFVFGPILWNVMYDEVLEIETQDQAKLVAYADDLAAVVTGNTTVRNVNTVLEKVDKGLEGNKLEIAPEKTEIVTLTDMRRPELSFLIRGERLTPKKEVKYLGVMLDRFLTFGSHVKEVCRKVERTIAGISRLMPNIGGPRQRKRVVLARVMKSIILYVAPVWGNAVYRRRKEKGF